MESSIYEHTQPEGPAPRNRKVRSRSVSGYEQTISLVTCNIEGVKAYKLYLQKLCKENEIVCLQEHWF